MVCAAQTNVANLAFICLRLNQSKQGSTICKHLSRSVPDAGSQLCEVLRAKGAAGNVDLVGVFRHHLELLIIR